MSRFSWIFFSTVVENKLFEMRENSDIGPDTDSGDLGNEYPEQKNGRCEAGQIDPAGGVLLHMQQGLDGRPQNCISSTRELWTWSSSVFS